MVSSYLEAQYPFTQPEDAAAVFEISRQAYVATREADLPVGVSRELDGIPDDALLYLVPSTKQLTAPSWRQLIKLAEGGATVYASVYLGDHPTQRGPWWPDLDATFGVKKTTRYGLVDPVLDDTVTLRFQRNFGPIPAGEELTFPVAGTADSRAYLPVEPTDADVVAVDGHGRPALLSRRTGRGAMVLGTYPLEYFAAITPDINPEPTWRLYDALAIEAGVVRAVTVADPRIAVAELHHHDGRSFVWFVNHSAETIAGLPCVNGHLVDADGARVEKVELAPYAVTVVERIAD